jgi:hypothetical protein
MGIPHLKERLAPYAETSVINDKTTMVIDGPALAHHIMHLCEASCRSKGPFDTPSYDVIGRVAIKWLDIIKSSGAKMSVSVLPET